MPGRVPAAAGGCGPERGEGGAAALLREAGALERAGRMANALAAYAAAIAAAERAGDVPVLSEALRRLAVQRYHRGDRDAAHALCERSVAIAAEAGAGALRAEALNTLGGLQLSTGLLAEARRTLLQALDLGAASPALLARVEQNLGILANIQGQLEEASARYRRSLDAFVLAGDEPGCAIAYNNLGMVSADRGHYDQAERYFRTAEALARRLGDAHLRGLALVNRAEADVARQRYENARQGAEEALGLFAELGAPGPRAECYRVLGMVFRETGRPELAEARFRDAMDLAVGAGSVLGEAEAAHELAVLCQTAGRNQEALRLLDRSYALFRRLDARVDLVHVGGRLAELEATYLNVVRSWGRSIEAADPATFGHSERVATTAVAVARALGLPEADETAILLGAYLHDVGMLRVPHEILAKRTPLSRGELAVLQAHPVWGVELLDGVEFPWDIKSIVRWHHERWDGGGYPDGLSGERIPLAAQVVGIAEAYDAIRVPRGGGVGAGALEARERIAASRAAWSPRVLAAFLRATSPESPVSGEQNSE